MMKHFRFFIVLFLTGCTAVHEWNYTPLPVQTAAENTLFLRGDLNNPVEAEFEPLLRQISLELAADLKDCCAKQPKICN